MAARSGSEFLERLSAARVHVEIQGETLTGGVADHPAFSNVVRSYAGLYDMQHDPAFRDILTYPSPATGEPAGTSRPTWPRSSPRWRRCARCCARPKPTFSGRQALYEYYFFGDPVRMAGAYVASYDREPYKAAVQAFLDRS